MKNIFANLARHLQRVAGRKSDHIESPGPSEFSGEDKAFESFTKNSPVAAPPTKPIVSKQPISLHSEQARPKASELQNANAFNSNFITREELKRELDLVRRLIESRK